MNIQELQKGQLLHSKLIGNIQILKMTKKYIKAKQIDFSGIVVRLFFQNSQDDISSIGLSVKQG